MPSNLNHFFLLLKNEHDFERWIHLAIVVYLILTIFPFILHFLHQFSISLIVGTHSAGLCFSTTFPWFLYWERRKEQAQPQLPMAALREQSTWNPEQRQGDRWNEHVGLNRHAQCASDFQFRDISVNSLGNFKGLSRSQSLLMLQTYGRNLKKVSSQNWMCLQLMHWMNVRLNIIIKTLPLLWTSLLFEGVL